MAQQLRALVILPEDLVRFWASHGGSLQFITSVSGDQHPFLASINQAHSWSRHKRRQNIHTHKSKILFKN